MAKSGSQCRQLDVVGCGNHHILSLGGNYSGVYDPQVHLSLEDVAVDKAKMPTMISLRLKRTKTDQIRKGVKVVMGMGYAALLHYLSLRGDTPGPLFRWKDAYGTPLTRVRFVRSALERARLPAKDFARQSFRITTAAGLEYSTIQTLGRWKSAAYLLYQRVR